MTKAAFANLDVDLWVHPGKLGLAQPTICLFHDSFAAGGQLLDALAELKQERLPAQRVLTFKTCSRPSALCKLRLRLVSHREDLKVMHVGRDRDAAIVEMTEEGLQLLTKALGSWFTGGEDFGVSPRHSSLKPKELGRLDRESGEIWFWGPELEP